MFSLVSEGLDFLDTVVYRTGTSSLVNFVVVMSSYEDEECHSCF